MMIIIWLLVSKNCYSKKIIIEKTEKHCAKCKKKPPIKAVLILIRFNLYPLSMFLEITTL